MQARKGRPRIAGPEKLDRITFIRLSSVDRELADAIVDFGIPGLNNVSAVIREGFRAAVQQRDPLWEHSAT